MTDAVLRSLNARNISSLCLGVSSLVLQAGGE